MSDDFCVEEMMKTRFPQLNQFIRRDYSLTTEAIDEWFKRCLADIPEYFWGDEQLMEQITSRDGQVNTHSGQLIVDMLMWRDKWFSQFIEKGDNDE